MADGVRIRIVGDDSEFVRTLEGLEKRTQAALRGMRDGSGDIFGCLNEQMPLLKYNVEQMLDRLSGNMTYAVSVNGNVGDMAAGIAAQRESVMTAAQQLAAAARAALSDVSGAYGAGVNVAEGFQRGIAARRAAVTAAARSMADAAVGALRSTLQIQSPSRVTMRMGEFAGQGFEQGLTRSLQAAVRSAGQSVGALDLSVYRTDAGGSGVNMDMSAVMDALTAAQARPVYLNVDGKTLASAITDDMRLSINRRGRNIDMGLGR